LRRLYVASSLLLCLLIMSFSVYRTSAASTTVAVDPPISNVTVGSAFNVNVNVTNIVNFTSWQLDLFYLNSVLNCTNAVEGPFLQTGGGTFFLTNITNNYNSTVGRLDAACSLEGATSVSGSGVILTVTFKAVGGGSTNLTLAKTKLLDEKMPPQAIPHIDINGAVNVTGAAHDNAVTNITPYKTCIGRGYSGNIDVTVGNLGGYPETFNTTVNASQTIIATFVNTTLTVGSFSTFTFTWNTTGFAYGNYTISAYAVPVPGDINTTNNSFSYGNVTVTIPGDLNGDFKVILQDLVILANAYGTRAGIDPPGTGLHKWNPNADINNDGVVGLSDLVILATHYGQHFP
jgi:hypothetical protein